MSKQPKYYLCVRVCPAGSMSYTLDIRPGRAYPELTKNPWFRPITFTPKAELGILERFLLIAFNGSIESAKGIKLPETESLRALYHIERRDDFLGLSMDVGAETASGKLIGRNLAFTLYNDLPYQVHAFPHIPEPFGMRAAGPDVEIKLAIQKRADETEQRRREYRSDPLGYSLGRGGL